MRYRRVFGVVSAPMSLIVSVLMVFSLVSCSHTGQLQVSKLQESHVALPQLSGAQAPFLTRQVVRDYINDISREHRLDPSRLANLFAEVHSVQSVLDAISRPAEKVLTWAQYRPIFIKQKRIDAGREFMREHAATLERAEQAYGVPANIIAAIIGVETFYGKITGKYGVLESVATLAFDYPPRAKFFKSELTEFLILSQAENWDTLSVKGSYAGAMGWPQFISSSYRHDAIDFDNDGKRDLFNSVPDVIGSVANYLNRYGWQENEPIADLLPVTAKNRPAVQAMQRKSLKPQISPKKLTTLGFNIDDKNLVSVVNLQGKGGEEAWVGYKNFYAITRYNHSAMYALAVYQLSESLTNQTTE